MCDSIFSIVEEVIVSYEKEEWMEDVRSAGPNCCRYDIFCFAVD